MQKVLRLFPRLLLQAILKVFTPVETFQVICKFPLEFSRKLVRESNSERLAKLQNQVLRLWNEPAFLDGWSRRLSQAGQLGVVAVVGGEIELV